MVGAVAAPIVNCQVDRFTGPLFSLFKGPPRIASDRFAIESRSDHVGVIGEREGGRLCVGGGSKD